MIYKFQKNAQDLVQSFGSIVDKHQGNTHILVQFFNILLNIKTSFDLTLIVVNLIIDETTFIKIEYNNLLI